jgi:predicted PolB exonuclease-like 3'-5' exonuclease
MKMSLDELLGESPSTATLERPVEKKVEKPVVAPAAKKQSVATTTATTNRPSVNGSIMYFDLETVPDYERRELFGLDDIPEPSVRTGPENWSSMADLLSGTLEDFKAKVLKLNPSDEVCDAIDAAEKMSKKPRKGVFDLTSEIRRQDQAILDQIAAQRKTMSVTPEMNRIIAFGYSIGNGITYGLIVDPADVDKDEAERKLLIQFWSLVKSVKSVCGFNIIGFDLPTIFVRSILLDVMPSREFDMKPWGNDVVDVMAKRYPKSGATGLKKLCRMMGIPIPAGDVDGSQVEELWKTEPKKVAEYVRSDVDLVKELHRRYRGFFC